MSKEGKASEPAPIKVPKPIHPDHVEVIALHTNNHDGYSFIEGEVIQPKRGGLGFVPSRLARLWVQNGWAEEARPKGNKK